MKRELTPSEIMFKLEVTDTDVGRGTNGIKEFNDAYKKIERAINIDKEITLTLWI